MPRLNYLSPSGFDAMMTNGRGKSEMGKTALAYAETIAMRNFGVEMPDFVSFEMQWGIEHEPNARFEYSRRNFCEVVKPDWIQHPTVDYVGGTPDGLVGTDGLVEIKCPNSANHLRNILRGEQVSDYEYQIQGYLWITGRKWCDFISYDPRFPDPKDLHVVRVERDEVKIQALAMRCAEVWEIVKQIEGALRNG
jgi:hypothetical protein